MEKKTMSIDLMLTVFLIGIFTQKIDTPEMLLIWLLVGLFIGLVEHPELLGNVVLEIPVGALFMLFLGFIFELIFSIQLFESTTDTDKVMAYYTLLYHPLLVGMFTLLGAVFPIFLRFDRKEKKDLEKSEVVKKEQVSTS